MHRVFSFACVGAAIKLMANETWKFVQAKSKQAMKLIQKQVLGIRDEKNA